MSIFFGGRYIASGFGPRATWKEKFIRCLTSIDHNQAPLIVMDPIVARLFANLGFDSKEKLATWRRLAPATLTALQWRSLI